MKKHLKVVELFAGIGAPRKALMRGGYNFTVVDAIEIDKYPVASYNAIYGENIIPQSITDYFPTKEKLGEIDLIWNSSPCQDISTAGKGAGAKEGSGTRSSLIYEAIRVVEALKPKYVVWENVKGLTSKKHRPILDDYIERLNKLGYKSQFQVLNAKDYGIPQNRERVFVVSILGNKTFEFPQKQELKTRLKDILEDEVEEKYYLSDEQVMKIKNSSFNQNKRRIQEKDYCDTLCARDWKDPKCVEVKRIGGVFDTEKSTHQAGSIYDTDGISPTLDTMQGGWRQPCVVASRGRYNADGTTSQHFEVNNSGYTNTITTVQKDNYIMEEKQNDGFVERKYKHFIEENGYMPNMFNPYNEKEIHDVAPTQSTYCGSMTSSATVLIGEVEGQSGLKQPVDRDYKKHGAKREECIEFKKDNCSHALRTSIIHYTSQDLRIRKLTPKECWRLMGFDDEDFERAAQVNSNTQLYKQAGNSVVVNVIEAIFDNLLTDYQ